VPFNIASGNSSGYNYSSGRLDYQNFFKEIEVERDDLENIVLEHIFEAWLQEAILVYQIVSSDLVFNHTWFWDGVSHVDPVKEANAQKTRLTTGMTTKAAEYAEDGKDYETEIRQIAKEKDLELELEIKRAALRKKLMTDNGLTESDLTTETNAKSQAKTNKEGKTNE